MPDGQNTERLGLRKFSSGNEHVKREYFNDNYDTLDAVVETR
ncbi:hypothetical protein [Geomicrobium sp. JCM 19037]|nr:hypothetical protein [Geomicrobium sp. JCM 19037]